MIRASSPLWSPSSHLRGLAGWTTAEPKPNLEGLNAFSVGFNQTGLKVLLNLWKSIEALYNIGSARGGNLHPLLLLTAFVHAFFPSIGS